MKQRGFLYFLKISLQYSKNKENLFASNDFKLFLAILSRGTFLPDFQEEWIDHYKSEIESRLSEILLDYTSYCNRKKKIGPGLSAANILLSFTPFNEDALRNKIQFLVKIGNPYGAKTTFENFMKNYKKTFGESSDLFYNNLLDKKS